MAEWGRGGGECYLLLERCCDIPRQSRSSFCSNPTSACQGEGAEEKGHPFVRVWAERTDGTRLGREAEWPVRRSAQAPSWFCAKPLGVRIAEEPDTMLRLQVRDAGGLVGELSAMLGQLPGAQAIVETPLIMAEAYSARKPSTVTFQVLDSSVVLRPRTVFFIRHAESTWNAAQSKGDLTTMAQTTDHPISVKGRGQAEGLRDRIDKAQARDLAHARAMLGADAFYVSPLTRAIQTAVIGLGPGLLGSEAEEAGELMLMGSAREKQNFGGRDSMSTKTGADILRNAHRELCDLYNEDPDDQEEIDRVFGRLRFDVRDAEEEWWCPENSDSKKELGHRLDDFISQLLYTPHRTAVVVGHSHFFREVYRKFLSAEWERSNVKFSKELKQGKMDNCGVVRVELDAARELSDGPIVSAELVLGSKQISDGGNPLLKACCEAPSAPSEMDELQIKPE